eukprot:snap_masked-scaffold_48-processed-gene-0.11-mRNA-1 protein AED:1.00 eAED:1.00 QI:0/-1/0/0/-1/1/1/0/198
MSQAPETAKKVFRDLFLYKGNENFIRTIDDSISYLKIKSNADKFVEKYLLPRPDENIALTERRIKFIQRFKSALSSIPTKLAELLYCFGVLSPIQYPQVDSLWKTLIEFSLSTDTLFDFVRLKYMDSLYNQGYDLTICAFEFLNTCASIIPGLCFRPKNVKQSLVAEEDILEELAFNFVGRNDYIPEVIVTDLMDIES